MSARPRLLDLFSCAGGAAMGYHLAGFDVVGVDIKASPRYPFEFHRADAMTYPLDGFDVVHASPPCQRFTHGNAAHPERLDRHPDLLTPTLARLKAWGGVWVVENVPRAPLPGAIVLCGSEFGLRATDDDGRDVRLRRHRLFASNVPLARAGECHCALDRRLKRIAGSYGGGRGDPIEAREVRHGGYTPSVRVRAALLGIDWGMTQYELAQAIPPAYTLHIGRQLMRALGRAA